MSIRRKKNETFGEFLLRSEETVGEFLRTTPPESKYRMEPVVEVVEHPVFGRIEQEVTYRDKNGRVRVKMRRAKSRDTRVDQDPQGRVFHDRDASACLFLKPVKDLFE